jgi:DNA-binding response OmpR family regulator
MPVPTDRPILVVDDDEKILRLVRMYLEREGFSVREARDGQAALAAIALHDPALVVLDLMLPEVDGLSVLRAIRRRSRTPVIILSARGTVGDRIEGLESGADDYVPKPFSPAELILRVQRVLERTAEDSSGGGFGAGGAAAGGLSASAAGGLSGGPSVGAAGAVGGVGAARILRHNDLVMDLDRHEVTIGGESVTLTTAEFRLLAALIGANGRVLTRDQLLDALHGLGEAEVLDRAIDAHVRRLRDKLNDEPDRPRFVATVRGVGYRAAPAVAGADGGTPDSPDAAHGAAPQPA